jgi:hypothetical protein
MLAGPAGQAHPSILDQHVTVGRRDVDVAGPDRLVFSRVGHRQLARPSEQIGEDGAASPDMGHDQHGPREIRGQGASDRQEPIETPRGTADCNQVAPNRSPGLFKFVRCHPAFLAMLELFVPADEGGVTRPL